MSMSPSLEPALPELRWPVETDIYILPDGQIVVADLPAELAVRLRNACQRRLVNWVDIAQQVTRRRNRRSTAQCGRQPTQHHGI